MLSGRRSVIVCMLCGLLLWAIVVTGAFLVKPSEGRYDCVAKWLYNGEEFYNLPEYDTVAYPYAVIVRLVDGDGNESVGAFLYLVGGNVSVVHDSGNIYLSHTKSADYSSVNGSDWNQVSVNQYDTAMLLALKKPGGINDLGIATGAVTIWSNFDIYNEDGTLYLAGSQPVPVAEKFPVKDWLTGFIRGLASKPVPIGKQEREPVAYLYNGVRLPALPEWDKESYPYAQIADDNGVYCLMFSNFEHKAYSYGDGSGGIDFNFVTPLFECKNGQWVETNQFAHLAVHPLVWTNYNLHFKTTDAYGSLSGMICMPASVPIPVYE